MNASTGHGENDEAHYTHQGKPRHLGKQDDAHEYDEQAASRVLAERIVYGSSSGGSEDELQEGRKQGGDNPWREKATEGQGPEAPQYYHHVRNRIGVGLKGARAPDTETSGKEAIQEIGRQGRRHQDKGKPRAPTESVGEEGDRKHASRAR